MLWIIKMYYFNLNVRYIYIVIINVYNEVIFKFFNVRGIWGIKISNILRIMSNNNSNNGEKKKNIIE